MSEILTLNDYMKEDALLFDNLSTAICSTEDTNYEEILEKCEDFERKIVLFKIVPTYYVMKTILYFKLNDYANAHKYINGSLKYLLYVAKNATELSEEEQKNFDEYKTNVLNQYKILTQEKPEYLNAKKVSLPYSAKFITSSDEEFLQKEIDSRVLIRKV